MPSHPEHTFRTWLWPEGQGLPQQLLGHSPTPPGSRGEHMPYASPPVPRNTLNRGIKSHPLQPETREPRLRLIFQHSGEQVGCCARAEQEWEQLVGASPWLCLQGHPSQERAKWNPMPVLESQHRAKGNKELGLVSHHCPAMASEATSESSAEKSSALYHNQPKWAFMSF